MRIYAALVLSLIVAASIATPASTQDNFMGQRMPYAAFDRLPHTALNVRGGELKIAFAPGDFANLSEQKIVTWLHASAEAVTTYYGKFPVTSARILIVPRQGRGTLGGQAFGYRGPAIRLMLGTASTEADLTADWKAVHEMVHLALPDVPDDNLWLAEGLAVYIEPVARVQAGDLTPEKIWGDMVRDMPKGLPQDGDEGLDNTHTWGRTYWGGAIFCLLADVELRKRSGNRLGLQQAMRAVVAAGGTHDQDWPVTRIFAIADKATGFSTMSDLYERMRATPYEVDLPKLWKELGIKSENGATTFDDTAPLAAIRKAITEKPGDDNVHAN